MKKDALYSLLIFICLGLNIFAANIIISKDYWEYTSYIIGYLAIAIIVVSIILMIINKEVLKKLGLGLKSRSLGAVIMSCCIFLFVPYTFNKLNEIIFFIYKGDTEKIAECKVNIYDNLDELAIKYNEIKVMEVYEKLDREQRGGLLFYYDVDSSKESIDIIEGTIKEFHSEVSKIFKVDEEINAEIAILLSLQRLGFREQDGEAFVNILNNIINLKSKYAYEREFAFEEIPEEVKEELRNDEMTEEERLEDYKRVIIHEYTHKLTVDAIDKYEVNRLEVPKWFLEGIAGYAEKVCLNQEFTTKNLVHIDLKDNNNFNSKEYQDYYDGSAVFINNLINKYGDTIIIDILTDMSKVNDIYKSIENVTGTTFDDIEENIYN